VTALDEALRNCEREPIATPGRIQSWGSLFVTDVSVSEVRFASRNARGPEGPVRVGAPVSEVLGPTVVHDLRNAASRRALSARSAWIGRLDTDTGEHEVVAHRAGDLVVVELLPTQAASVLSRLDQARAAVSSVREDDLAGVLMDTAVALRSITGFDRVSALRFLPDGCGEVLAESRAARADAFVGLRFPAHDVPQIVRDLYLRMPFRWIVDVEADEVPLLGSGKPDLSLALLRGVSPVHVAYLRNMGVRSSMSVPIVVGGRVWGLFTLHHLDAVTPDVAVVAAVELVGRWAGAAVARCLARERARRLRRTLVAAGEFVGAADLETSTAFWHRHGAALCDVFGADGLAYVHGDRAHRHGTTPTAARCVALRESVAVVDGVGSADRLGGAAEPDGTAGILRLRISETPAVDLLLLRLQASQKVDWAGDHTPDLETTPDGPRLHPRQSFARYVEEGRGRSDPWTHEDLDVAGVLLGALQQSFELQATLRDSHARLQLVVRELDHRVRNILALVRSIAAQSTDAAAIRERVASLARAHDLLTARNMTGADLRALVDQELLPHLGTQHHVSLDGPRIDLDADVAPLVSLLVHELTTNAVKHGSLSVASGRLRVHWAREQDGLSLTWEERGGPAVVPGAAGFGRSVIAGLVPYELGGRASLELPAEGATARFWLPAGAFRAGVSEAEPTPPPVAREAVHVGRALVVEDSFLVARELSERLTDLGFTVDMAGDLASAQRHLDAHAYALCVLDADLRGESSAPLVGSLEGKAVPYLVATGFGEVATGWFPDALVLTKPVGDAELVEAIASLRLEVGV
jgi:light-regulated signal transduction histidine kinase (bacteriophytochrome)